MPEQKNTENKSERGLVVYTSRDGQAIKLSFDIVKRYLVSGKAELVTEQEMMLYMACCKARGLNPFKRDAYLVKYTPGEPAATIVSIDYFRSRAKSKHDCVGWKTGIIIKTATGLEWREGAFIVDGEQLLGGWFKGKPKGWTEDYQWSVALAPYVKHTREGAVTAFWRPENQAYMISKVAESQGLRRLWPDEFQGLFTQEEIIETTVSEPGPEDPTKGKLPEPARKINAKEQKRFAELVAKNKISIERVVERLALYKLKTVYEVTTDILPELMAWAERPDLTSKEPLPSGQETGRAENPQDPKFAPSFELTPEDDIPSDWPEGTPHDER